MTENKMTLKMLKASIDELLDKGYSPDSIITFVDGRYKTIIPEGFPYVVRYLIEFDITFKDENFNIPASIKMERNGSTFLDIGEEDVKTRKLKNAHKIQKTNEETKEK